jgi:hypothetical protein
VELRHASSGAYYAAFTVPDGLLVARSRAVDPHDAAAAERAKAGVARALQALGWRPAGAQWVRGGALGGRPRGRGVDDRLV